MESFFLFVALVFTAITGVQSCTATQRYKACVEATKNHELCVRGLIDDKTKESR